MKKSKTVTFTFPTFTLKGSGFSPELQAKRLELFGDNDEGKITTSRLSDMSVCQGVTPYRQALPKMTKADADSLIALVKRYHKIYYRPSKARQSRVTKLPLLKDFKPTRWQMALRKITQEIDSLLREIVNRP